MTGRSVGAGFPTQRCCTEGILAIAPQSSSKVLIWAGVMSGLSQK
jgi:hypothetical protein